MTGNSPDPDLNYERAREQASEWLSILRSSDRSAQMESDFRVWLQDSLVNRQAFDAVTQTWEMMGAAGDVVRRRARVRAVRQRMAMAASAACALLVMVVSASFYLTPTQTFETKRGEQRTVVLSDGSRVSLNTDTKVVVRYRLHRRSLNLDHGEAAFDVVHDKTRPFVVTAEGEDVTAVGTYFTVRAVQGDKLGVTLLAGRLMLASTSASIEAQPVYLAAGQQWTAQGGVLALNAEKLQEADAWRRGEVVFDEATLAEAVSEMNRYGGEPIHLDVLDADNVKVSGIFRLQDDKAFADALAGIYGLSVEESDNGIHIRGRPQLSAGYKNVRFLAMGVQNRT